MEAKMKFFFEDATGLNADISRHREVEARYKQKIAELEHSADEMDVRVVALYRNLLSKLMDSKATVVSKIGKTA